MRSTGLIWIGLALGTRGQETDDQLELPQAFDEFTQFQTLAAKTAVQAGKVFTTLLNNDQSQENTSAPLSSDEADHPKITQADDSKNSSPEDGNNVNELPSQVPTQDTIENPESHNTLDESQLNQNPDPQSVAPTIPSQGETLVNEPPLSKNNSAFDERSPEKSNLLALAGNSLIFEETPPPRLDETPQLPTEEKLPKNDLSPQAMINVNPAEELVFQNPQEINQNNGPLPRLAVEAVQGSSRNPSYMPQTQHSSQPLKQDDLVTMPFESPTKDDVVSSTTLNDRIEEAPSRQTPAANTLTNGVQVQPLNDGKPKDKLSGLPSIENSSESIRTDSLTGEREMYHIQTPEEKALEKDYDSLFQAFTNETPESPSGPSLSSTNPQEFSEKNKPSPQTTSEADSKVTVKPAPSFTVEPPELAGARVKNMISSGKEKSPKPLTNEILEPISPGQGSSAEAAVKNNEYLLKTFAAEAPESLPQSDLSQSQREGSGSKQASRSKPKEKSNTNLASPLTTTKKVIRSSSRSKTKASLPSSKPFTTTSSEKKTKQLTAESQAVKSTEKLISQPYEQAISEAKIPKQTSFAEAAKDYEALTEAIGAQAPGTLLRSSKPQDMIEAPDAVQASKTIPKEAIETTVASPQTTTKKATRSSTRSKTRAPKASSNSSTATSPETTLKLEAESQFSTGSEGLVSRPSEQIEPEVTTPSQASTSETAEKEFESLSEAFDTQATGTLRQSSLPQDQIEVPDATKASQTIPKEAIETTVASPQTTTKKATRSSTRSKTRAPKASSNSSTATSPETTLKLEAESQLSTGSEDLVSRPSEQIETEVTTPSEQASISEIAEKDFESLAEAFDAETPESFSKSESFQDQSGESGALQASKTNPKEAIETTVASPQATTKKATRSSSRSKTMVPKASSNSSTATSPETTLKLEVESQLSTGSEDLVSRPSEQIETEVTTPSEQASISEIAEKDFGSVSEAPDAVKETKTIAEGSLETELASPPTPMKKGTRDSSRSKTRTPKTPSNLPTTTENTNKQVKADAQVATDSDSFIYQPSEQMTSEVTIPSSPASVAEVAEKDYESLAEAFDAEIPESLPQFTLPQDKREYYENLQPSKPSTESTLETEALSLQTTSSKGTQISSQSKARALQPVTNSLSASPSENNSKLVETEAQVARDGDTLSFNLTKQLESTIPSPQEFAAQAAGKNHATLSEEAWVETSVSLPQSTLSEYQNGDSVNLQTSQTSSIEIPASELVTSESPVVKITIDSSRAEASTPNVLPTLLVTPTQESVIKQLETELRDSTSSENLVILPSEQAAPEVTFPSSPASVAEADEKDYETLAEAFDAEIPESLPQFTLPQDKREYYENLQPSKTSSVILPDTKISPQNTPAKTIQTPEPTETREFQILSNLISPSPSENTSSQLPSESRFPSSGEGSVIKPYEQVMPVVSIPSSQTSVAEDSGSLSKAVGHETSGSLSKSTLPQNQRGHPETLPPSETFFDETQPSKLASLQATTTMTTQSYARSETSATKPSTTPLSTMPLENATRKLKMELHPTTDSKYLYSTSSEKLEPEVTNSSLISATETSEKAHQLSLNASSAELTESIPHPKLSHDPSQDTNVMHASKSFSEEASIDLLVSSHAITEMAPLSSLLSKSMTTASLGKFLISAPENTNKESVITSSDVFPTSTTNSDQMITPTSDTEASYSNTFSVTLTNTEPKLQLLTSTPVSLPQPTVAHDTATIEANIKENISNLIDGHPRLAHVRTISEGSWSFNEMPSMTATDLLTSDTLGNQISSQAISRNNLGKLDQISATLSEPISMPTKGAVENHTRSEPTPDLAPVETLLEISHVEEFISQVPTQGVPELTVELQPKISEHKLSKSYEPHSQTSSVDHHENEVTRNIPTTTEQIELPITVISPTESIETQAIQTSEIQPTSTKKTNPHSNEPLTQARSIVEANIPTSAAISETSQEEYPVKSKGFSHEASTSAIPSLIQTSEKRPITLGPNLKMEHPLTQEEPSSEFPTPMPDSEIAPQNFQNNPNSTETAKKILLRPLNQEEPWPVTPRLPSSHTASEKQIQDDINVSILSPSKGRMPPGPPRVNKHTSVSHHSSRQSDDDQSDSTSRQPQTEEALIPQEEPPRSILHQLSHVPKKLPQAENIDDQSNSISEPTSQKKGKTPELQEEADDQPGYIQLPSQESQGPQLQDEIDETPENNLHPSSHKPNSVPRFQEEFDNLPTLNTRPTSHKTRKESALQQDSILRPSTPKARKTPHIQHNEDEILESITNPSSQQSPEQEYQTIPDSVPPHAGRKVAQSPETIKLIPITRPTSHSPRKIPRIQVQKKEQPIPITRPSSQRARKIPQLHAKERDPITIMRPSQGGRKLTPLEEEEDDQPIFMARPPSQGPREAPLSPEEEDNQTILIPRPSPKSGRNGRLPHRTNPTPPKLSKFPSKTITSSASPSSKKLRTDEQDFAAWVQGYLLQKTAQSQEV